MVRFERAGEKTGAVGGRDAWLRGDIIGGGAVAWERGDIRVACDRAGGDMGAACDRAGGDMGAACDRAGGDTGAACDRVGGDIRGAWDLAGLDPERGITRINNQIQQDIQGLNARAHLQRDFAPLETHRFCFAVQPHFLQA